jgi:hypothetical protein
MSAATRMAVPVASGWNDHTAAYGLSLYSVIDTTLSKPGHGIACCPIAATLK